MGKDKQIVCPDCLGELKKAHIQDEEGHWSVIWLCDCESYMNNNTFPTHPSPEKTLSD